MIRNYLSLVKPGIILGNLLPAAAGFLLAAQGAINLGRGAAMLAGLALVIGSATACNSVIDRDIDGKMARTKDRPLPSGTLSSAQALAFAAIIGILGLLILAVGASALTAALALFGFFAYVALYSWWAKLRTPYHTLIGAISGSVPPLVGYAAASPHLGAAAWILAAALTFWQMPHFYAIAIYRAADYRAAGVPTMPARYGMRYARTAIILYVFLFALIAPLLTLVGAEGWIYAILVTTADTAWLALGIAELRGRDDARFARRMFFFSLIVLLVLCGAASVSATLGLP